MATDDKTSLLISEQFPDYFRTDGANLVAFVRAYYQWLEQSNNVIDVSKNFEEYMDIDQTLDGFIQYFRDEFVSSIPDNVLYDKPLLIKHAIDLYRAKGDEQSFRLLFRLLYGEEIEFYYPGEDILRASDGRWIQDNSIRVGDPVVGDVFTLEGQLIQGQISGATAKVERIRVTTELGVDVFELFLSNISGEFEDQEQVALVDMSVSATIVSTTGPLQGITVTSGGSGHVTGDSVTITGASGTGALGTITETSDNSSVEFDLVYGGEGYRVGETLSTRTVTGGTGSGGDFNITAITNTEFILVRDDIIEPMAPVVLDTGPTFVSLGTNTAPVSSNLASSNVSSPPLNAALSELSIEVGRILTIETTDFGVGYSTLPSASIIDNAIGPLLLPADNGGGFKGRNAIIDVVNAPGSIAAVSIDPNNRGNSYSKLQIANIVNARSGTLDGGGVPIISGVISYPGGYIDTKGWLSWDKRLQDNFFYQEYSYVIKSTQTFSQWAKFVRALMHPAGTQMFSEMQLHYETPEDIMLPTVESEINTWVLKTELNATGNTGATLT